MKIIKQIVVLKRNNGYHVFLPEYPDIFTGGGPSKEDARYMIKIDYVVKYSGIKNFL